MTEAKTDMSTFITNDAGEILPVVENFYRFCTQRKLMATRCGNCSALVWPPRPICPKCLHYSFEWVQLRGEGKLLTFTVIYFPPTQFQALAPYAVGIAKLTEGLQMPGMIRNVKLEGLQIGMNLKVEFEPGILKEWPRWTRYFFTPSD